MEQFPQIMIVGPAKVGKERGPLIYSGSDFDLVPVSPGTPIKRWCVVYWFWVPPGQRQKWRGRSANHKAAQRELQMLADGVIEEERYNVTCPADITTADATRLLLADYNRRCVKRLGSVPEPVQRGALVDASGRALALVGVK